MYRKISGYALASIILLLCYIYSFTIAASKDSQWELSWLANFIVFLLNDLITMPIVILILKWIIAQLSPEIIASLDKELLSANKLSHFLNKLESDKTSQPPKKAAAKIHPHPGTKENKEAIAIKCTISPIMTECEETNSKPLLSLGINLHNEAGNSEKTMHHNNNTYNDTITPPEINSHTSLLNHEDHKENNENNEDNVRKPSIEKSNFEDLENGLEFKVILEEKDKLLGT